MALHLDGCVLLAPTVEDGTEVIPVTIKDAALWASCSYSEHPSSSEDTVLDFIQAAEASLEVLTLRSGSLRALGWWISRGPSCPRSFSYPAYVPRLRRLEVVDQQTPRQQADVCRYLLDAIDTDAALDALPALTDLTLEWAPSLRVALIAKLVAGQRIKIVG